MANFYSADYRHFDRLIWQVPAWSTAVFLGTLAAVRGSVLCDARCLHPLSRQTTTGLMILAAGALFMFVSTYALYRNRLHQSRTLKPGKKALPGSYELGWLRGAQFPLQLVVTTEAVFLLCVGLRVFTVPLEGLLVGGVLLVLVISWHFEGSVRRYIRSAPDNASLGVVRWGELRPHKHAAGPVEETRRYYISDGVPMEIIETEMPPGTSEEFHAHRCVREATIVLEGEIEVKTRSSGSLCSETLGPRDMAVFPARSCHTMHNRTALGARTLTVKFFGEGWDLRVLADDVVRPCNKPLNGGVSDRGHG